MKGPQNSPKLHAAQSPTIPGGSCDGKADCYLSNAVLSRLKWDDVLDPGLVDTKRFADDEHAHAGQNIRQGPQSSSRLVDIKSELCP